MNVTCIVQFTPGPSVVPAPQPEPCHADGDAVDEEIATGALPWLANWKDFCDDEPTVCAPKSSSGGAVQSTPADTPGGEP